MHGNGTLLRRVAEVAHECWREQMLSDGWSYGSAYASRLKRHDALLPFGELAERDQREALLCARAENLAAILARAIEHPRGPDRPFFLDEMREGRRVVLAHSPQPKLGSIVSWEAADGELVMIRVRWDDGGVDEFNPWLQALARPEDLESSAEH